ncbi:sensor histidine kinase [Nostoc sp.]|uniref:sensor histidine kinase n=1 Tax=Nostoc sp. TaxID=1180 RepID=UPI002FF73D8C
MLDQTNEFILIVDDNPTNLSVLKQALKAAGLNVRLAEDGKSAIAQVHRALPALILLDVQMPVMDGFETCSYLKADPHTREIPIIFMTALADTENTVKGLSLGAVDYITKPFEQEEILARVRVHLQMGNMTKTLQQMTATLEQKVAERTASLQKAQVQLVQQEKLSILGELVAGVAHEINNPISCISNNVAPAQEYVAVLQRAIHLYQAEVTHPSAQMQQELEELDLEFVLEDLPKLLDSMKLSSLRIIDISVSLRNFCRADIPGKVLFDVHQGLDSTLLILQHRLKGLSGRSPIQVIKEYGKLPEVECYPGQLNQVFMNLLANAIDALEESNQQRSPEDIKANPHRIEIQTRLDDQKKYVVICIRDNGMGMSPEIQQHIFDHLFTTKAVGKGTGLGLAIARQIVEDTHRGQLSCNSQLGKGTEFAIALPI